MRSEEYQWKVESAANTLTEAEKLKSEFKKDGKFKKAVMGELKKRTAASQAALNKK